MLLPQERGEEQICNKGLLLCHESPVEEDVGTLLQDLLTQLTPRIIKLHPLIVLVLDK